MEGGNPSSVLQCKSIVKSIILIDDKLICGLDNGAVEVFQWENGIHQCQFSLYNLNENETTKDNVNDYQVIHLCLIDCSLKIIIAQCRNGDLFSIDLSSNEAKILSLIRTGIESFVKIGYYSNPNKKDLPQKKIIAASEKENQLIIIDLSDDYQKVSTSNITLTNSFENDEKKDIDIHDDNDNDTIISNKSLINCILAKEENAFIVFSFESCFIQLTTLNFELITFIYLNEGKTAEPIITMNSFTINTITYITIGLFSVKGIILQYHQRKLAIAHVIDNLSSQLRCGISSIVYSQITKLDLLSIDLEETTKTKLLCFGGYDHRVKFYEILTHSESTDLQLKQMGNLILPNQKIINQIIISSNKDKSNYLFVASDQRLLYIYLIA